MNEKQDKDGHNPKHRVGERRGSVCHPEVGNGRRKDALLSEARDEAGAGEGPRVGGQEDQREADEAPEAVAVVPRCLGEHGADGRKGRVRPAVGPVSTRVMAKAR
jgi:hypothetical protein